VPATSTSVGAYAGHFNWGPVDAIVTVSSEKELASYFGAPTNAVNSRSFLTAASFLKYSNALRVSRAISTSALNAADSNQILIKNKDHFDTIADLEFIFSARYPGAIGNSITVSYVHVAGDADNSYDVWPYKNLFDSAPNQSLTAVANGIATNDEIHVVVIDTLGLITGTKGSVLERYEGLSLGSNAKNEDGASIFYKDVINSTSSYIYVNTLTATFAEADSPITEDSVFSVVGGSVSNESTLDLPFVLSTETTVTYSGGASVTTTTNTTQTVVVKSGYTGTIGNNAKVNIRLVDSSVAPAKAASGFINYGVPINGDIVIVGTDFFTKAATSGVDAFSTINELATLINGITDLTATVVGGVIGIVCDTAGAAGNAIALGVDGDNAGTMTTSAESLKGGSDAASVGYHAVDVDVLSAATGYVTYDVTVAADQLVVGPVTTNVTDVTLADIITEIKYKAAIANDAALEDLTFEVNGVAVTAATPIASMKFNIESVLPYTALNQAVLEIIPFTGGEIVNYNDNTLITTIAMLGGVDGSATPGNVVTALDLFADKELVDINFLFSEVFNSSQETVDAAVYEIANTRKDILASISAPIEIAQLTSNALKKAAVISKFDSPTYTSSSYVVFAQTPVYTYNKYADSYVWVPDAGHTAGLCANADFVADPWFSPAGFNRGQLKGVTKIAYNPGQTDRDDLYKKRINSIVSLPGEGVLLIGDKTALSKPSAFDRINVRRLFNVLQRSISTAAKYQLFELNDEFTRASFKNTIEPFLRDVQGRRGIIEYRVVCDETNNTPEVIDGNEFVGDIYVKPARSINFIKLNFIATRTGVEFKEIVGG
jgi:phage tail sheath protein FI